MSATPASEWVAVVGWKRWVNCVLVACRLRPKAPMLLVGNICLSTRRRMPIKFNEPDYVDGVEWVRPSNRSTREATVTIDLGGHAVGSKAIILGWEWMQVQDLRALKQVRLRLAIEAAVKLILHKIGA